MLTYGDNPILAVEQDWLDRSVACKALQELLQDPQLDMPLTLGIYGDWGSGKTSIMRVLAGQLPGNQPSIWFNAWEYAQQRETLWRAFLLAIVTAFRKKELVNTLLNDDYLKKLLSTQGKNSKVTTSQRQEEEDKLNEQLDRIVTSLYRSQTYQEREGYKINWSAAAKIGARSVIRIMAPGIGDEIMKTVYKELAEGKDIDDAFRLLEAKQREEYREHVQSLEQFREQVHSLLKRYLSHESRRLVIFIDDLDRCLPEDAVSVLEAIKIFFDSPTIGDSLNCIFVLGMDRNVVEQGIRVRYREFAINTPDEPIVDARQYLDKIIQLPFHVPPLNTNQMARFITRWCREHGQAALDACNMLIAIGVAPNPRSVKRTLNVLRLMSSLRSAAGLVPDVSTLKLLAKIVVLQTSYDDVYRKVVREPHILKALEEASRNPDKDPDLQAILNHYPRLRAMIKQEPWFPSNPAELNTLIF